MREILIDTIAYMRITRRVGRERRKLDRRHIGTHNAHHLGQIIVLRQMMGLWPPPAGSWTW